MTVKFQIQKHLNELCRLGVISEIENLSKKIETPTTFLYTKDGTVPYLTPDMVAKLKYLPEIVQVPLNYIAEKLDVLEKYNINLSSFIGLKDAPIIITQSDQILGNSSCGTTKNSIFTWCTGGRRKVDLVDYFRLIKCCKPFLWQTPCDNDTTVDTSSEKRLQSAVERSISFRKITEKEINDQNLPGENLVSFTGGANWLRRRQCLEGMLDKNAFGFILDGFLGLFDASDETVLNTITLIERVISGIRQENPNSLIMVPAITQPGDIVQAVRVGVDLFDGSFPFRLTVAQVAWTYPGFEDSKGSIDEPQLKRSRENHDSEWLKIDLFSEDFENNIDKNCDCFACERHSRGYIYHLFNTDELLGFILLMTHNSTQYYKFFHDMRQAMADGNFQAFHDWALRIKCPNNLLVNEV